MATITIPPDPSPTLTRRDGILESNPTPSSLVNCSIFTLPANGSFVIDGATITLDAPLAFTPACLRPHPNYVLPESSITNIKAPFHASETPQAYATGAATVLSWMLVVMLIITPRTFFVGGVGGGVGLLGGGGGIISGAQGRTSVIGVGSRPWLQKVAAISVAISLTIATADTFKVAERQYYSGFMNIESLRAEVTNSTQIKISRIISDIFLWLAQVQTLIRLFTRHKEKVLIKWIGFGLIVFDTTFTCLNSFAAPNFENNETFRKAIPTLSDTFQLALSLLYACWVLYYVYVKRRYAFYHPLMWNVSVVAFLSLLSLATPIIFFIIDIANRSIAGWGDYFRWVGLAAASVIVWEWVERIEALEREEKKDGILGREIYDEDESDLDDDDYRRSRARFRRSGGIFDGQSSALEGDRLSTTMVSRAVPRPRPTLQPVRERNNRTTDEIQPVRPRVQSIQFLPQTTTPISRADTASAASTVYTVQYNTFNLINPPIMRHVMQQNQTQPEPLETGVEEVHRVSNQEPSSPSSDSSSGGAKELRRTGDPEAQKSEQKGESTAERSWMGFARFFKRSRASPPAEIKQGQVIDPLSVEPALGDNMASRPPHWDLRARFAPDKSVRISDLPVTFVPAPTRGGNTRPWSPEQVDSRPGTVPQDPENSVEAEASAAINTRSEESKYREV